MKYFIFFIPLLFVFSCTNQDKNYKDTKSLSQEEFVAYADSLSEETDKLTYGLLEYVLIAEEGDNDYKFVSAFTKSNSLLLFTEHIGNELVFFESNYYVNNDVLFYYKSIGTSIDKREIILDKKVYYNNSTAPDSILNKFNEYKRLFSEKSKLPS